MGGTSLIVVVNGAQLSLQTPDGRTIPLLAESETSFFHWKVTNLAPRVRARCRPAL
jgi:hypothetical protein